MRPASMDQDAEVTKFLRYFVGRSGKPAHDTGAGRNEERACNADAAEKVVKSAPNKDQVSDRFAKRGTGSMTVVPMQELLEGEEYGKSANKPCCSGKGWKRFNAF